jgi:CRP-like cAMP-binding protein
VDGRVVGASEALQGRVSGPNRIGRLRAIPLFAALDDAVLQRIAAIATEVEAPRGQVLTRANDPGAGMFVVEQGKVAVELRSRTIEFGPGEFFGELSLLAADARRVARVRATEDSRLLALSRADFGVLLEDEPSIALAMLPVLAQRLVDETLAR